MWAWRFLLAGCGVLAQGPVCPLEAGAQVQLRADLAPGELLHVEVEALGANLALELLGADGRRQALVNERWASDGIEELFFVAAGGGPHTLVVRSRAPRAGAYRLHLVERREASAADRVRAAALARLLALYECIFAETTEAARALVQSAPEVARGLEQVGERRRALWARYLAARMREERLLDPAGARADLSTLLEDARQAADLHVQAYAQLWLSTSYWREGRVTEATPPAEQALVAARAAGDRMAVGDALHNFGNCAHRVGRRAEAEQAYLEAVRIQEDLGRDEGAASIRLTLGHIRRARGDLDAARRQYEEALRIYERVSRPATQALAQVALGMVFGELGQHEAAVERLEAALRLSQGDEWAHSRASALLNLAAALARAGRGREALARYAEAEALARQRGYQDMLSTALRGHGRLEMEQRRFDQAAVLIDESLSLSRATGDRESLAADLARLAELDRRRGLTASAGRRLGEGLEIARKDELSLVQLDLLGTSARLARDERDPRRALADARSALAIAESVRGRLAAQADRASFLESVRALYLLEVELELELERDEPGQGHAAEAFAAAERGRARLLLELLDPLHSGQPSAEAQEVRDRAVDLQEAQRRLLASRQAAPGTPERESAERALAQAAAAFEAARSQAERALPGRSAQGAAPATVGAAAAQATLDPSTALLEYVLGDDVAVLFVLRRDRFSVHRLAGAAQVTRAVEELLTELAAPSLLGAARFRQRALRAYDLLVRPAEADLRGAARLLVSPDGSLHRLPFAVLVEDGRGGASYGAASYLVRRRAVARVASASVLAAEQPRRVAAAAWPLVGFGNPAVADDAPAQAARTRAVLDLGTGALPALPGSAVEVSALGRLFPGSRVFVGTEASELRVKGAPEVGQARYLHFAAHGLASALHPSLSALLLAPGGPSEDGLLQAWEIARLGLVSDLVVLSACRSALGRETAGEGFLGLPQAFLQAGARAVVASLWTVDDRATAALMERFYRQLARGAEPSLALAAAQRASLGGTGLEAHPSRWAPFVLLTTRPPASDE